MLHDYTRDTELFDQRTLEVMQFDYLREGFHPAWDYDPYRVFVYTTLQERATQYSHAETGRIVGEYEPGLARILHEVAQDEARHFVFYRKVFAEILKRDPNQALESAAHIMPGIEMPGHTMPGFKDLADVIRRTGIYGPRDYLKIVQEQMRAWGIENITGLSEMGRKAQEKIMGIPSRLERIADLIETRSRATHLPVRGRVQPRVRAAVNRRWASAGMLLALACGKPAPPPPVAEGATRVGVPAEATALGNELFELIDRAVEYRGARMGRPPESLRDLGLDSLTPTIGPPPVRHRTDRVHRAACAARARGSRPAAPPRTCWSRPRSTRAGSPSSARRPRARRTYEVARPITAAPK